jgi:Diacylglycerol kinase catalytic domain
LGNPEHQQTLVDTGRIQLVKRERLVFVKPLAIIVNPNSGKKRDVRVAIQKRLDLAGVPFEFLLSTKYFMTWELAFNLDMDKYSALIAVGGDGTYHEVVNGMLHRGDKRRLPVGFIPNGSGNDTLRAYNVTTIDLALDYIVKGDLLKVDLTRVLLDYDSEADIPPTSPDFIAKLRYQLVNSSSNIPAKVNVGANKFKSCCCNPYQLAAVVEFTRIQYDLIDLLVDGAPIL